jgi:hypothetical protein
MQLCPSVWYQPPTLPSPRFAGGGNPPSPMSAVCEMGEGWGGGVIDNEHNLRNGGGER